MGKNEVTWGEMLDALEKACAVVRQITAKSHFNEAYREARLEKRSGEQSQFWILRYMPQARASLNARKGD